MSCQMFSRILCSCLPSVPDTGVRDDDVEPAELFDTAVDRGFEAVEVADIDLRGDDAPVLVLDQICGLGEILRGRMRDSQVVDRSADVDRDDVGAFLRPVGQRGCGPARERLR